MSLMQARRDSSPPRGTADLSSSPVKVHEVRRQWAEFEDGAIAYQLQNEEINNHYGLNRFNNRMVRQDIPVARQRQEEEEYNARVERDTLLRQIEEEDDEIAKKFQRELELEEERKRQELETKDEEYARQLQMEEEYKHKKHALKKQERKLEQRQQEITHTLQEQAMMKELVERDMTDLVCLPPEDVTADEKRRVQEEQDAELALFLQQQEHQRRGDDDRGKVRQLEVIDSELAFNLQEQEKLRLKVAKQRRAYRRVCRQRSSPASLSSASPPKYCSLARSSPSCARQHSSGHSSPLEGATAAPLPPIHPKPVIRPYESYPAASLTRSPVRRYQRKSPTDSVKNCIIRNNLTSDPVEAPSPEPVVHENLFAAIDPTFRRRQKLEPTNNSGHPPLLIRSMTAGFYDGFPSSGSEVSELRETDPKLNMIASASPHYFTAAQSREMLVRLEDDEPFPVAIPGQRRPSCKARLSKKDKQNKDACKTQ